MSFELEVSADVLFPSSQHTICAAVQAKACERIRFETCLFHVAVNAARIAAGTASLLFGQAEQGTTVGVITDISGAVGSGGARFRVLCFPARH